MGGDYIFKFKPFFLFADPKSDLNCDTNIYEVNCEFCDPSHP